MELEYISDKLKEQCENVNKAKKLFSGNNGLAISLIARINALKAADTLKDIVVQPTFHFHKLNNKNGRNLEGFFAVDVKSRKEPWRIIIQPLDDDGNIFNPCNIDSIADSVRIVEIEEVSKHYE